MKELSPGQKEILKEICAQALEQWLAQLAWKDLVALGQIVSQSVPEVKGEADKGDL
jgi:hypothetical protein